MLARRIIPCLDIDAGRVVKGVQFQDLKDMGDPVERAQLYCDQGADELTFLDVTASADLQDIRYSWVKPVAEVLDIPFTVGGGIRHLDTMRRLLEIGADKISLSTAAVDNPDLINQATAEFGSQFVVLSVDTLFKEGTWWITVRGGRDITNHQLEDWVREAVDRGVGEILLNVMNSDGTRQGYNLDVTSQVADQVSVPVIASGGVGHAGHIVELFQQTGAQAALAASIFHDGSETVGSVKQACADAGVVVRT